MASTTNKPFHTYENVGYDDQVISHYVAPTVVVPTNAITTAALATTNSSNISGVAINRTTAIDSPFPDPLHDPTSIPSASATRILSATDSTGTTRMLTSRSVPGQNLVTKLISLPSQSPMDSLREWSVSTFKCTKQMINERRGNCSITNDAQLQADIDQLRETRNKLVQMFRTAQQMNMHYSNLVKSQRQLHGLMSEMSIKFFTSHSNNNNNNNSISNSNHSNSNNTSHNIGKQSSGKQIVANFSSLSNNLSSTTTSSPSLQTTTPTMQSNHPSSDDLNDFLPILKQHIKSSNVGGGGLTEDFKKNALALNATIKNGEKLTTALTFFCSNLSTLINKTIEDTLTTVKQFEAARLEYDAERNSINFTSQSAQTSQSITYSSDKLELARVRYEQLKEEVQIKIKFLEENTIKVMHKQLLLFNSAFASYSSGNTAALDSTLRQFSIR